MVLKKLKSFKVKLGMADMFCFEGKLYKCLLSNGLSMALRCLFEAALCKCSECKTTVFVVKELILGVGLNLPDIRTS